MIRATGVNALQGDLRDLARALADTSGPDSRAAAIIAADARPRARRDTGAMGSSITPVSAGVEVGAPYAPIVVVRFDNPFLTDALAATTGQVEDEYAEHVETATRDIIRTRY